MHSHHFTSARSYRANDALFRANVWFLALTFLAITFSGGQTVHGAAPAIRPIITSQPRNQSVPVGSSATFSVTAIGSAPLYYQWRENGTNLLGATNTAFTVLKVTTGPNRLLSVVVSNAAGKATSVNATLSAIIAPTITNQPQNVTVSAGVDVSFTVAASGTAPFSYQWRLNGTNIHEANSATFALKNVQPASSRLYSVVVSNAAGSATSRDAALVVNPAAPSIVKPPANVSVSAGSTPTFSVVAAGSAPLAYQWRLYGTNLIGTTNSTYSITNAQVGANGGYSVVVNNSLGTVTSGGVTLTIRPAPPKITLQPKNLITTAGSSASFSAAATGTAPLFFQWYSNGVALARATNTSLVLSNLQGYLIGPFNVLVSNSVGVAFSYGVTIWINPTKPTITSQPTNLSVVAKSSATFRVSATGTAPITYQWRLNGADIIGATASSYTLTNVEPVTNARRFTVVVRNFYGKVTSAEATLGVNEPPVITSQPQNQSVKVGSNSVFAINVAGTPPFTYQWRRSGTNITGATSATYTFTNAALGPNLVFSVFVSNVFGSITSSNAILAVVTNQLLADVKSLKTSAQPELLLPAPSETAGALRLASPVFENGVVRITLRHQDQSSVTLEAIANIEVESSTDLIEWHPVSGAFRASESGVIFEAERPVYRQIQFFRLVRIEP